MTLEAYTELLEETAASLNAQFTNRGGHSEWEQ